MSNFLGLGRQLMTLLFVKFIPVHNPLLCL